MGRLKTVLVVGILAAVAGKVLLDGLRRKSQQRGNEALRDDIKANLYVLVSEGKFIEEPLRILPFDFATVRVAVKNVLFCFTRGRDELSVLVPPCHAPGESHLLAVVIAGLESRDGAWPESMNSFPRIAAVLLPRLDALNQAFAKDQYAEFKKKL